MTPVGLDIYGLRVRVSGWEEVVESLRLDFAFFARTGAAGPVEVEVEAERRSPDFDSLGEISASFVTPRNVVYQDGERTIIDYFGRAISVLDRGGATDRLTIQGEEEHLVHEAGYHFLTSRAGEHLDRLGMPRMHALALAGEQGAVAVMLPSGGGKTTLALRALEDEGVRLLSEDSALLDRRGRLHPFPLRIGVNATDAERLPPEQVRRIERMEFHPKLALDLDSFSDRIERRPVPLRHLVLGRRSLGREARLERIGRRQAAGVLLREVVVGVGIYQGMEFLLQRGMRDVIRLAPVGATRARCSAAALARSQVWELTLGRDHERNWELVRTLLGPPGG